MLIKTSKKKKKTENGRTNYTLEKTVPAASILKRLRRPSGGEAWKEKSIFEEAPSLAKKSAHWFPSQDK